MRADSGHDWRHRTATVPARAHDLRLRSVNASTLVGGIAAGEDSGLSVWRGCADVREVSRVAETLYRRSPSLQSIQSLQSITLHPHPHQLITWPSLLCLLEILQRPFVERKACPGIDKRWDVPALPRSAVYRAPNPSWPLRACFLPLPTFSTSNILFTRPTHRNSSYPHTRASDTPLARPIHTAITTPRRVLKNRAHPYQSRTTGTPISK